MGGLQPIMTITRRMRFRIAMLVPRILMLLSAGGAAPASVLAQGCVSPPSGARVRLRVLEPSPRWVVGALDRVARDTAWIRTGPGAARRVTPVVALEVSRGRRGRGASTGFAALAGLLVGGAVGAAGTTEPTLVGPSTTSEGLVAGAVLGAAAGALVGAVVGGPLAGERWQRVPPCAAPAG